MTNLEQEAGILGASLVIYGERKKLPRSLFDNPDHIAIGTPNINEFGRLVREEVAPRSLKMSCAEVDWQFRAAARLRGRMAIYDLGLVEWIAVEEPKRESQGDIKLRAVFYHDSLETVRTKLDKKGIRTKITPEKNGAYVNVEFDPQGLEFRMTDTPLAEIAEGQIDSGEAVVVNLDNRQSIDFI